MISTRICKNKFNNFEVLHMSKYLNKGLIAFVSSMMLLPVSEIFAQSVIEEITVTARQKEESLRMFLERLLY